MGLKVYLPLALVVFFAATTGADLIARTSIAGETFESALRDHFHWAFAQFMGTILLLVPFVAVAFICALAERLARSRGVVLIFIGAMLTLLYFYFQGYQEAQYALLEQSWTAAALSVGLLPFAVGLPLLFVVVGAGAVVAKFDRRTST